MADWGTDFFRFSVAVLMLCSCLHCQRLCLRYWNRSEFTDCLKWWLQCWKWKFMLFTLMVFSLNASNNWIMEDSKSSECWALVQHEPCILRFVLWSIGYFKMVLEKKTNREKRPEVLTITMSRYSWGSEKTGKPSKVTYTWRGAWWDTSLATS